MSRPFVLVTGGRDFSDFLRADEVLCSVWHVHPDLVIVQGGARGADALARKWCEQRGVPCITVHALWDYYGKRAGSMRNGWMQELFTITYGIAFPGGSGTADMVRRLHAAGVPVHEG